MLHLGDILFHLLHVTAATVWCVSTKCYFPSLFIADQKLEPSSVASEGQDICDSDFQTRGKFDHFGESQQASDLSPCRSF